MELNPFEFLESEKIEAKKTEFGDFDYSYEDLVNSISKDIKWISSEQNFYYGDLFFLGEDSKNVYFTYTGYGSCCGCDELQGCFDIDDLERLRDDIKRKTRKFDSLNEFEDWFNTEAQFNFFEENDIEKFIKKVNDLKGLKLKKEKGRF